MRGAELSTTLPDSILASAMFCRGQFVLVCPTALSVYRHRVKMSDRR